MIWYILFAVFILILGAIFASVGIRIRYGEDDGFSVILRIRVFGIPVCRKQLFPEPEERERIRPEDYSPAALEKKRRKEERIKRRKARKAARKKKRSGKEATAKPKKTFSDKVRLIKQVARTSAALLNKFGAMLHIRIDTLRVTVGGEDAARAAITYGLVSQGIAYLAEILSHFVPLDDGSEERIDVSVDFLSEGTSAEVDILFHARAYRVLGFFIGAFVQYYKNS